jgi:hypothetical protein
VALISKIVGQALLTKSSLNFAKTPFIIAVFGVVRAWAAVPALALHP